MIGKKFGLSLMLLAMLAAPMLACGFPLPAGTEMMAVSKAACPDSEAAATCEARRDAYQLMSKLQSAVIEDLSVALYVDDGETVTEMLMTGEYDYVVTESAEGLGANVSARIEEGRIDSEGDVDDLSGAHFMLIGAEGYLSRDGGASWEYETLDEEAMAGMAFLLGVTGPEGSRLDLFSDPGSFSVTLGEPVAIDGQQMQVQTLTLNLGSLLANPEALGALLEGGAAAGGDALGMGEEELSDMSEFVQLAPMFMMFMAGSEFSTTLYIGEDDGFIHRIEDNYVFKMDVSAFDAESAPVEMRYQLSGNITRHNGAPAIAAPQNAVESDGVLSEEGGLFGGGLGSSLFGQ